MKTIKAVLCALCLLPTIIIPAIGLDAVPLAVDSVRKFDEYGDIPNGDEKARLDNFYHELRRDPNTIGYIIVYAGRRASVGTAKTRAVRARNYLVQFRDIAPERVVWIDGGHREELSHELFIFPRGVPAPTAAPTIAPEDVQIIKDAKPKKRKQRGTSKARRTSDCR